MSALDSDSFLHTQERTLERTRSVSSSQLNTEDGSSFAPAKSVSGRVSPVHTRTLKEYDKQLADFQKENFSLKLRIFFLEEQMKQKLAGRGEQICKQNIDLKIKIENLKQELNMKQELLKKASEAMLNLSDQHRVELDQAREQVADECRSRARSDTAAYEQMIAELQLNIFIADTKLEALEAQLIDYEVKVGDLVTANRTISTCWRESEDKGINLAMKLEAMEELHKKWEIQMGMMEDEIKEKDRRVVQLRNELRSIESLMVQKDEDEVEAVYAVTQEFKGKISELYKKLRRRSEADAEENDKRTGEVEALEDQLILLQSAVGQLKNDNKKLSGQLHSRDHEACQLAETLEKTEAALLKIGNDLKVARQENKVALEMRDDEISQLKTMLRDHISKFKAADCTPSYDEVALNEKTKVEHQHENIFHGSAEIHRESYQLPETAAAPCTSGSLNRELLVSGDARGIRSTISRLGKMIVLVRGLLTTTTTRHCVDETVSDVVTELLEVRAFLIGLETQLANQTETTGGRFACVDDYDSLRLNLPLSTGENVICGSESSQFYEVGPLSISEERAAQGCDRNPQRINQPMSFDRDVVPNWECDQADHPSISYQTLLSEYIGKHSCRSAPVGHGDVDRVPSPCNTLRLVEVLGNSLREEEYCSNGTSDASVVASIDCDVRVRCPSKRWLDASEDKNYLLAVDRDYSSIDLHLLGERNREDGTSDTTRNQRISSNCGVEDKTLASQTQYSVDKLMELTEKGEGRQAITSCVYSEADQTVGCLPYQASNLEKRAVFERLQKLVVDNRLIAEHLNDELEAIKVAAMEDDPGVVQPQSFSVRQVTPTSYRAAHVCDSSAALGDERSPINTSVVIVSEVEHAQGKGDSSDLLLTRENSHLKSIEQRSEQHQIYDCSPMASSCRMKLQHARLGPVVQSDTISGDCSKSCSVVLLETDANETIPKSTKNEAFGVSKILPHQQVKHASSKRKTCEYYRVQAERVLSANNDVFQPEMNQDQEVEIGSNNLGCHDASSHIASLVGCIDVSLSSTDSPRNAGQKHVKHESRAGTVNEEVQERELKEIDTEIAISVTDKRVAWVGCIVLYCTPYSLETEVADLRQRMDASRQQCQSLRFEFDAFYHALSKTESRSHGLPSDHNLSVSDSGSSKSVEESVFGGIKQLLVKLEDAISANNTVQYKLNHKSLQHCSSNSAGLRQESSKTIDYNDTHTDDGTRSTSSSVFVVANVDSHDLLRRHFELGQKILLELQCCVNSLTASPEGTVPANSMFDVTVASLWQLLDEQCRVVSTFRRVTVPSLSNTAATSADLAVILYENETLKRRLVTVRERFTRAKKAMKSAEQRLEFNSRQREELLCVAQLHGRQC